MSLFEDKSMKPKQLKFLIGSLVIIVGLVYLGYAVFKSSMTYNQTVSEMLASKEAAYGRHIELQGDVVPGSIQRDGRIVTFKVNDKVVGGVTVIARLAAREARPTPHD